jgi:hypothetical protein
MPLGKNLEDLSHGLRHAVKLNMLMCAAAALPQLASACPLINFFFLVSRRLRHVGLTVDNLRSLYGLFENSAPTSLG